MNCLSNIQFSLIYLSRLQPTHPSVHPHDNCIIVSINNHNPVSRAGSWHGVNHQHRVPGYTTIKDLKCVLAQYQVYIVWMSAKFKTVTLCAHSWPIVCATSLNWIKTMFWHRLAFYAAVGTNVINISVTNDVNLKFHVQSTYRLGKMLQL